MNIQIGAQLILDFKDREEPVTACFVGEKNGKYIVVTFPEEESSYVKDIKKQDEIRVQYSDNDVRYEFNSKILQLLYDPVDLIVMEYPTEINSVDKRSSERMNCMLSAKLKNQLGNDTRLSIGIIENINKTGCLCILTKRKGKDATFSEGDQVYLKCQFPGLVGEQTAKGKVIRMQEEDNDVVIGIHFDEKIWWVPPYEQK